MNSSKTTNNLKTAAFPFLGLGKTKNSIIFSLTMRRTDLSVLGLGAL